MRSSRHTKPSPSPVGFTYQKAATGYCINCKASVGAGEETASVHRQPVGGIQHRWIPCADFLGLQDYKAAQLAKYLGPDQPLYAMRSCVGIVKAKDYTAEVLETVCNRYLWEMLALQVGPTLVLGGTCQGGILALAMARRLKQIGRAPALLALLEWSYSYGSYDEPTLLIYGEESYTAQIYQRPEKSRLNGGRIFPKAWSCRFQASMMRSNVGTSVACLVKILNDRVGQALAARLAQNRED